MTTPSPDQDTGYTALGDPGNIVWVPVVPLSEDNPFDEGELDEDGLTEAEYEIIFGRPAAQVPSYLVAAGDETAESADAAPEVTLQSRMDPDLKRYWLRGEGAAKIGWGSPGAFKRCVSNLREHFPQSPEGLCANLYHEATGHWPGEDRGKK